MKNLHKSLVSFVLLIVLLFSLSGCRFIDRLSNTPPSYYCVELSFDQDREDLLLVTEYMIHSGATTLNIFEDCKTALADLEEIEISDKNIIAALKRLREQGYTGIFKHRNTVEFCLWTGIRDISCGIAFLVGENEIDIQYVTETKPLPEDGWFYYVTNYNEWRSQKTTEAGAHVNP